MSVGIEDALEKRQDDPLWWSFGPSSSISQGV